MNSDDLNRITKMAFWMGLVVNLLIGFHCFQYASTGSGIQELFVELPLKIGIILLCIVMSAIFCATIYLVCKHFNEILAWIFSFILIVGIPILNYKLNYELCMSINHPKPPSIEKRIKQINHEAAAEKKQVQKLLNDAILFSPDKKTVLEDQSRVVNEIKCLLSSFDEPESNYGEMNDSTRLDLINRLLERNFKNPVDTMNFHYIRDSLLCDFMSYSPDCKHFIAILTSKRNSPSYDIYYYLGMVLFCEKKDDAIDVYSHTTSQYGEYSREIYTNDVILRYFQNMGRYFLDSESYKKQSRNILRKIRAHPQDEKLLFDTIVIQNKKYLRYQTESTMDYSTNTDIYSVRPVFTIK